MGESKSVNGVGAARWVILYQWGSKSSMPKQAARANVLPPGAIPLGLSREQAAAYIGVGVTTFDRMIRDGLMPRPIRIYGRTVWHLRKLEAAFAALDAEDNDNDPWSNQSL